MLIHEFLWEAEVAKSILAPGKGDVGMVPAAFKAKPKSLDSLMDVSLELAKGLLSFENVKPQDSWGAEVWKSADLADIKIEVFMSRGDEVQV